MRRVTAAESGEYSTLRKAVPKASAQLIGELGAAWLARKKDHMKPASYRAYACSWRSYVEPRWGALEVSDVSHAGVQEWVAELSMKLSGERVVAVHSVLARVLDDAVLAKMLAANPARGVKLPERSRTDVGARLRRRVKLFGWRVSRSGSVYQIVDRTGQVLHRGPLAAAEVFMASQPGPALKYRSKPVPQKWAQPIDDHVLTLAAAGYRPTTLQNRRTCLATMARGLGCAPDAVTAELLVGWFGKQQWTPETRKGYRSTARGFFLWAYRTGRIAVHIADEIPKPRPPHAVPRPAPDAVFAAALAVADARTTLMLRLAGEAGLRRSEVAQVHTRDLLQDCSLLVHGKGGKQRVVPISDDLAELIRRGPIGHTPELAAFGWGASGWLFPEGGCGYQRGTGHISPGSVGVLVSRALPEGYTMHMLRHRFATRAFRGSRNLRAVQKLLGHASIATTERYTAVDDDEIRAAAASAW